MIRSFPTRRRPNEELHRGIFVPKESSRRSILKRFFFRRRTAPGDVVPLSRTERACAASHLALWRAARDGADTFAVVFEDDVVFRRLPAAAIDDALDAAPADADLVLLGYWLREEQPLEKVPERTLGVFYAPRYFWGAHAYALTPSGAAKLLRRAPVDCPVDVFLAAAVHDGALKAYAVKRKIAKQRTQDTSSIVHTNRLNADVVHNASKRITFDLAADLADRVC